ncbi:DUF4044 domain-containing protein [Lacticaseibacillus nasuensis]|nr:DUF4044 domain-containing protein [Lacticaseibacillus nasuensis]MCX2454786.1 DUF4044 domain-containing protein [Lacticaseibacillus nasuensis]
MKQKRTKFWVITHIAAWAMLIVTVAGSVAVIFSVLQ